VAGTLFLSLRFRQKKVPDGAGKYILGNYKICPIGFVTIYEYERQDILDIVYLSGGTGSYSVYSDN